MRRGALQRAKSPGAGIIDGKDTAVLPSVPSRARYRNQPPFRQDLVAGSPAAGETKTRANKAQGINGEIRRMRQANGGDLARADRRAVNQQQNKVSRQIYNQKHNARRG